MLESLFNTVAGLQGFNFIKMRNSTHAFFPVNIVKFLITSILKEEHLQTAASLRHLK